MALTFGKMKKASLGKMLNDKTNTSCNTLVGEIKGAMLEDINNDGVRCLVLGLKGLC